MIKSIFFDIDGTLVPFGDRDIPADVKAAIQKVRAKGVKVFIASGRHIEWIVNLGDTEFDGYVTSNGSLCLAADKKTCIFCHTMQEDDIDRLIDFSKKSDLAFTVIPKEGNIFTDKMDDYVRRSAELLHLPIDRFRPVADAKGHEIVQLMAYGKSEERERSGLIGKVLQHCSTTSWNELFCDIIPKGSDKSVGMEKMLEYFHLEDGECMAFGDGTNDIGMIKRADIGVAMGNSGEEVKSSADYVTADVTDGGVIKALRKFGLLD